MINGHIRHFLSNVNDEVCQKSKPEKSLDVDRPTLKILTTQAALGFADDFNAFIENKGDVQLLGRILLLTEFIRGIIKL